MLRRTFRGLALGAVCLAAGCGHGSEAAELRLPTATPTATTQGAVDVAAFNQLRDEFVAACRERDAEGGGMDAVRSPVGPLLDMLAASPDTPFKRSANTPAAPMRQRIRALATVARTTCGGPPAIALAERLERAAVRAS
jgi:hypothetical protein